MGRFAAISIERLDDGKGYFLHVRLSNLQENTFTIPPPPLNLKGRAEKWLVLQIFFSSPNGSRGPHVKILEEWNGLTPALSPQIKAAFPDALLFANGKYLICGKFFLPPSFGNKARRPTIVIEVDYTDTTAVRTLHKANLPNGYTLTGVEVGRSIVPNLWCISVFFKKMLENIEENSLIPIRSVPEGVCLEGGTSSTWGFILHFNTRYPEPNVQILEHWEGYKNGI